MTYIKVRPKVVNAMLGALMTVLDAGEVSKDEAGLEWTVDHINQVAHEAFPDLVPPFEFRNDELYVDEGYQRAMIAFGKKYQ